ncbi:metabolite traffic protein EboE [bacterium]|nr:metabolite traffic protein EboE [bacterium]
MALSSLPLGYCTNVHPGRSVAEVLAGLDRYTVPVRERLGRPVAAGLWLARTVVDELLAAPDGVGAFAAALADRRLPCYTLNAFPYGDFHAARVKEHVYRPDWSAPERVEYTARCAAVLAALLPAGTDGSISTLPLGFKGFDHPADFAAACARNLVGLARRLRDLRELTGHTVRLAIEPEPFCLLETTAETVAFFERLWAAAGGEEEVVRDHVGVCYDVCHQAVEFEDAGDAVRALARAGVRVNKVQVSCAVELENPRANAVGREALRHYAEPRYLHQVFAGGPGGVARAVDLTDALCTDPPTEFLNADRWRVHFHVPIDADRLGPLGTTKPAVAACLAAVAALPEAPHLEVETYTWDVLPGASVDLVAGLARELDAAEAVRGGTGNP